MRKGYADSIYAKANIEKVQHIRPLVKLPQDIDQDGLNLRTINIHKLNIALQFDTYNHK